jgi:hypothetical protein
MDSGSEMQCENVVRPLGIGSWLKQKRQMMIDKTIEQHWEISFPREYLQTYGIVTALDTVCYLVWIPLVSVGDSRGGVEWNISRGVAVRVALYGQFGQQLQLWHKKQVPHLIFVGFNL